MTYFVLCWLFSYVCLQVVTILTTIFMLSRSMFHTLITYCSHSNLVYLEMSLLSSLGEASY